MRTADHALGRGAPDPGAEAAPKRAVEGAARRWVWPALGAVLLGGLGLRLWGVRQGLPYAFNADEADHFVPHALIMFEKGTLNPEYFANPPAYTYLLHYLLGLWFGGGAGALRAYALHPAEVFTLARVAAAVLGTLALWLLYATGARLFSRGVGLLAAAIEAVAFLAVFYSHLALNDVPTLAPLTLALLGTAGVLRKGRALDYLIAGIGLGLACATKYTAGIVIVSLAAAVAIRLRDRGERRRGAVLRGLILAGGGALAAFLLANPYALLDYQSFHGELVHQSTLSGESQGKLGSPRQSGLLYYLWSFTWGLGWVPSLAAVGGALTVWRRDARVGWLLVPPALLFLAFMGLQGRYFGRWLLPIFPLVCLLGAHFALALAHRSAELLSRGGAGATRARVLRGVAVALVGGVLLAQGVIYSVHAGLVLSRADTRNLTREWMVRHIPRGALIVAEPVSPDNWAREGGTSGARNEYRWHKYPSLLSRITPAGKLAGRAHVVGIENYVRTLAPALIGYYRAHGYCWVLSGSTQSGRAFADPAAAPLAIAYYRALARAGRLLYQGSPYAPGAGPVAFSFDWSFDYYPLAYQRPGPVMSVYRLSGGRCRR